MSNKFVYMFYDREGRGGEKGREREPGMMRPAVVLGRGAPGGCAMFLE